MSLNASLARFKSEYAETAARNFQHSRPSSNLPTRTTTPKPGEHNKRTHDAAFNGPPPNTPAAAAAQATRQAGSELMTQLLSAQRYLKEKSPEITPFDNIISYLSLPQDAAKNIPLIRNALLKNARAIYYTKTASGNGKESFKYNPLIPVTNAEELKDYLSLISTQSASGVAVKDLKDGWPDCASSLEDLEKQGFLLITRWKKDNTPRTVFPDVPSYHEIQSASGMPRKADADFDDFWAKTGVPAGQLEVSRELEKVGLVPTSQVKEVRKGVQDKKKEKRRGMRKGTKTTNSHMQGILKDYSKR